MVIKELGTFWDEQYRNDLNNNFKELAGMDLAVTDAVNKANSAEQKAQEAKINSENANTTSNSVQEQLNTIVINGDSSVEAAQARVDEKNISHTTLKERIDSNIISINKQINDIGKNVKLFGAKGDGVTDDTIAVQAALDAGGVIKFPEGTYLCSTLAVSQNTQIIGDATGKTIIKHINTGGATTFYSRTMLGNKNYPTYKAPSATDREFQAGLCSNITISNITFDGQNFPVYGLQFITCDYIKMDNCRIINTKGALDLRAVRYSRFSNIECDNIAEDGISVTDQNFKAAVGATHRGISTRITFERCVVQNSCTLNGDGSSSMNAFEMDDGPSYIEYINCKAMNNRGSGFEIHIHLPEFDLSNVKYINCISVDNYASESNPTRQVAGFLVGQCPDGSKMNTIAFENCSSIGSNCAYAHNAGAETGYISNIIINGGYWESKQAATDRNSETSSCVYLGKQFRDMKIVGGATIVGSQDGYGIYSYGAADGLIISDCSLKNMYMPLRIGHTGGSVNLNNLGIVPSNPIGSASSVCVYITTDRVNIANTTLTIDSSKYSSSIMRLINVKNASVSAIITNTGAVGNNAFNTQDCENVTITGSIARGFTNAVMLSSTSQSVVVTGNSFKSCTNKFNTTPTYLVEAGNAI